jgi:hypothetical protein
MGRLSGGRYRRNVIVADARIPKPGLPVGLTNALNLLPLPVQRTHGRTCFWRDPVANDPGAELGRSVPFSWFGWSREVWQDLRLEPLRFGAFT